ncbi:hypothetical protein BDA99DRAFT_495915 [Phascolomyces articulosus]|uniref:Uncharacterized protein n=1 Tax=Phascolomyces articulosus TaxID=60185 RepID=A0AAD5K9D5_9FUNG|nr:hypothetical protein BDA99DRAFT_495915 [Phascolomyces articulosus]
MAGASAFGFHPHFAGFWHRFTGKALGASMWFWMMYRAKQDGPVLLVIYFLRKAWIFIIVHVFNLQIQIYYRACNTLGIITTAMTTVKNTTRFTCTNELLF